MMQCATRYSRDQANTSRLSMTCRQGCVSQAMQSNAQCRSVHVRTGAASERRPTLDHLEDRLGCPCDVLRGCPVEPLDGMAGRR
jgi:hypothetical protein